MRVLLAGATGALGVPLTRQLLEHGHEVLGLARHPASAERLTALGARPVTADALDRDDLLRAVQGLSADAVIHELTALRKPPRSHRGMTLTNRLRTEGTAHLLAAAEVLGAGRFLTQSIIFGYGYRNHGDRILTEQDPFGKPAGNRCDPHVAAMLSTEQQAFSAPHGMALRYGLLYGGDARQMEERLARRRLPVAHGGVLGWVHHEDAAAATVAALEHGEAGQAYNIVDDQPASWDQVFTEMAEKLGTPPPRSLPGWVLRMAAPYVASFVVGTSMRVSNAKAKRELGWHPRFPTYPDGIRAMVFTAAASHDSQAIPRSSDDNLPDGGASQ
jgi:nucleoside-diphosphate-sugar epimerase